MQNRTSQQELSILRQLPIPPRSQTTNSSNITLFQKGYLAAISNQSQDSNPFWDKRNKPRIPSWRFYNWWNKGYLQGIEDKNKQNKEKE